MTLSREEISDIARTAANKVLESQGTCVSAGMTLFRDHDSFRKATPIIFRDNVRGLVSEDNLKVPHSELAMHVGAAGKSLIAFALTGTQTGLATYDKGEGSCGFIFGREDELFRPPLLQTVNQMWEKRGPNSGGNPMADFTPEVQAVIDKWKGQIAKGEPLVVSEARREIIRAAGYKGGVGETDRAMRAIKGGGGLPEGSNPSGKPTRDDVRVEVWEERDRLHIGIQDKETGDYYVSWWDDDARQMFEDGFFKPAPHLEGSVLEYAEEMGILAA